MMLMVIRIIQIIPIILTLLFILFFLLQEILSVFLKMEYFLLDVPEIEFSI